MLCVNRQNLARYESLKHLLIIALLSTFRSELSSIKSNTEVVAYGLSNVQKTLPDVEARVSELSEKLVATNQTATQSIQNVEGILNLVISSHQADLKQLGQAQSNEFSQMKQLIQDLSLKMDANASIGPKVATTHCFPTGELLLTVFMQDIEVHRNLACLMSKPSALKTLCDEHYGEPTSWSPPDTRIWPACTCRCSQIITQRSLEWGPFRLSTKSKAEFVHHESCQWARFDTPKRSKAISLAYRGFTHLLRCAVVINFRLNHGAGGFSLGPGIVYYPVVDENVYAPFRLVEYVCEAMYILANASSELTWPRITLDPTLKHKVLEAFSRHISRACFNGVIIPRAVNIGGETLLHYISHLIQVT